MNLLPLFTPETALYLDGCVAGRSRFVGELLCVDEYQCLHDGDGLESERSRSYPTMIFCFTGASVCHSQGQRYLLDPTRVMLHPGGMVYNTFHDWGCWCRGLAVGLRPDAAEELSGADTGWLTKPSTRPLSAAHQLQLRALLARLNTAGVDAADSFQEDFLFLMGDILSPRAAAPPRRGTRAATARQHQRCVETTCGLLNEQYREALSLAEIAHQVYSSPAHLSRVFRRATGVPIHRYRTRLRLLAALDELCDRSADLSRLAQDLGFSSHSHLTARFRQEFGLPPAALRRELKPPSPPRRAVLV